MLTTADKKFLRETIRGEVKEEVGYSFGLYKDNLAHEMKITRELIETRPSREEVREIVYDVVHREMNTHVGIYHT